MRREKRRFGTVLILMLLGLLTVYPFVYMLLGSFKSNPEIIRTPPTFLPAQFTMENYRLVLRENRFGRYFVNSLGLAVGKTALILYTSVFFGYVFAKLRFRGRNALFLFVLATMMIPWPVTLAPMYS
jgi:multiple sugar transport system permease protein/raffinose/stachyose/melibiose transport system permease protein